MPWLLALNVVAVVTTAISWIPQAWRAARSTSTSDVSAAAWMQAAAAGMIWCIWGIAADVWAMVASEGLFAVGALVVVGTLVSRRAVACAAVGAAACGVAAVVLVPSVLLGALSVALSASIRVAQIARMRRRRSAYGVSVSSWALLTVSGAAWGILGIALGEWPLIYGTVIALSLSAAVALTARNSSSSPERA